MVIKFKRAGFRAAQDLLDFLNPQNQWTQILLVTEEYPKWRHASKSRLWYNIYTTYILWTLLAMQYDNNLLGGQQSKSNDYMSHLDLPLNVLYFTVLNVTVGVISD